MFKKIIRKLTKWAWAHEAKVTEGLVKIKELHTDAAGMEIHIQSDPELQKYMAHCFAALVASSPNYTELKFDCYPQKAEGYEWVTVTVKKGNGKTPHELRMEAERKLAEYQTMFPLTKQGIYTVETETKTTT